MITAEFTIEPFVDGDPGPHVQEAIEAIEATGLTVEVGPFGTAITGDQAAVLPAIEAMLQAAVNNGATRVSLQLEMT